ncbi:MAG: SMP-30/gluconolactonase/LRE family protein [Burkholderiales bacterium]
MHEICRGLEFPEGPIALADGSVLLVEIKRGTLSRVTPDGRIEVVADCGGGPNGAALGPDGRVYVCNNGGFGWGEIDGFTRSTGIAPHNTAGSIQAVDLKTGTVETLYTACNGETLKSPNDLVFDAHGGFYFTDLGHRKGRSLDRGGVYYAQPDGSAIREIAWPVDTANGVGLSADGGRLYVAETFSAKLRTWEIAAPGVLGPTIDPFHVGDILYGFSGYERLDSLALDSEGNILLATLGTGCVSAITPDGRLHGTFPVPEYDPMVTNVCFGGPDLRTLYITSSGRGRLYTMPWYCPGLKLNYAA